MMSTERTRPTGSAEASGELDTTAAVALTGMALARLDGIAAVTPRPYFALPRESVSKRRAGRARPSRAMSVPRIYCCDPVFSLSFPVLVTAAGLATLALVCVGIFLPAYLLPAVIVVAAVAAGPVLGRYVRQRVDANRRGVQPGAASFGLHSLPRVKTTVEAFNADAKPDVPAMMDYLLQQAALHQASDIHLVPYRDFLLVRYRIDGILSDVAQLGAHLRETITNRLKVMSQAVSFVHDRPQDGRIDLKVGEREVDLRVAFMPTLHGERIVMRVLDRGELGLGL